MTIEVSEDAAEALAYYYDGVPCKEAAQQFFASCADALIQAHERGERVALPLRLAHGRDLLLNFLGSLIPSA